MKKTLLIIFCVLVSSITMNLFAQQFAVPSTYFSEKKPAYFTMKDGSKVEAFINNISYKKSQISELKLKNADGKKVKVTPAEIEFMYLPQSAFEKFNQLTEKLGDARKWKSSSLDNEMIEKGYVYFESTDVRFGKKTQKLIMQVLNPDFCSKVRIYNDPYARESASIGVGAFKVVGGEATSLYFKKGDEPAFKITRVDYKKQFFTLWADCPALIEKHGKDFRWADLPKHIAEYTELTQ